MQDEERNVASAIHSTRVPGSQQQPEVVVVDGGSRDATVQTAAQSGCSRVISAPRGRGTQMNAGAAAATGQWLLFLHADSALPTGYFEGLTAAVQPHPRNWWRDWACASEGGPRWGCFQTIDTGVGSLKAVQWGVWLRTHILGRPYGDQGLFCDRACFHVRISAALTWFEVCGPPSAKMQLLTWQTLTTKCA